MKKLLIALTAVATGLFASTAVADDTESLPTGTGFETLTAGEELVTNSYWTASADPDAKMTVTAWNGEFPADITRPAVPGENNEVNYLSVKTKFGNPLIRKAFTTGAPTVKDGKIFFDSMVKFTATDEDPTTVYDNAKLIVYVKDNNEDDTTPATTTNLMVKAATGTYDLGTIDVDVWHRLTIKAVKAYTDNGELAFTVYVDETPKAATSAAFADTSRLTTEAKGINAAKRLFPSMVACESITEVGFDGQGCIDDLVFADTVEGDVFKENAFAITKGENITSYKWTVKSGGEVVDSATAMGDASIPAVANMTVEITEVQFAAGNWELAADETSNCEFEDGVFKNFGTGSAAATLIAEDTTPRVSVTIDEVPVTYPTLAKALAAISALESGAATMAFNKTYYPEGIQLGTYEDDGGLHTEATLISGATVTLDLAGCTITGPEGISDYAIMSGAPLVIVDTVGGGKIVPSDENDGAVYVANTLGIAGGTFDGEVAVEDGNEVTITGGSFLGSANNVSGEFSLKDAVDTTTYAITGDAESYFTVTKIPTGSFVVTVPDTAHVAEAVLYVNGVAQEKLTAEVKADDVVKVEATAAAHYEYDGEASYESDPVTVTSKMISSGEGLAYTVEAATATEYTFSYMDGESVFATGTYTVETQELTLNAGTKQGYKLDGWYFDPEFDPDSKIADGAALLGTLLENLDDEPVEAVFGKWTIDQAFGGGTGDVADPYVITTEAHLVELQEKVAAGDTFEGKYFQQRNDIQLTAAWKCIGTATVPFKGNYDGQNYTISDLRFAVNGDGTNGAYTYLGFFRYVYGGTIENLKIKMADDVNGFDLTNKGDGVTEWGGAAFVGQAMTNAVLRNLTAVSGTIAGSHNVAGIVIKAFPSVQILDCTNFVDLVAGYTKAAGIVVFTQKDSLPVGTDKEMTLTISNCRNVGTIRATDWVEFDKDGKLSKWAGKDGLGGIIDYIGGSVIVKIENCSSEGAISVGAQTNAVPVGSIGAMIQGAGLVDLGGNTTTQLTIPSAVDHANKAAGITDGSFIYATVNGGVATFVKPALDLTGETIYTVMAKNTATNTLAVGQSIKFDEAIASVTVVPDDAEKNKVERTDMGNNVYRYTCAALPPPGPTPVDDGKVEPDPEDPTGKTFVVTPADGKDSIAITGADSSMTIKVTSAADFTITGLNGAAVKVVAGGQEITSYVKGGDPYSTALDDVKVKAVVDDREGVDTPFAIGETSDVTIKAIPGLTYTLKVAGAVDDVYVTAAGDEAVKTAGAADTTITLKDSTPPEGAGFYKINIAK